MAAHPRFIHRFHPSLGNARHACYYREYHESSPTSDPTGATGGSYCVFRGGGGDGTLAGRRSVTGIRRRSAAPCVEFSLGLAPPSYAIDALNVCVRRITRSVSMANWRACSFGSVATYKFGHARIDGSVLKLNTLLFCRLPVQFV